MARILVTGGAGFIGSHVVDRLVPKHRVFVVDNLSTGLRKNLSPQAEFMQLDIRSPRMHDVFRGLRPEYVFHLAAQKTIQVSVNQPLLDADINITGSLNLLELARTFQVKKFIFSSSGGALYGDGVPVPTPESVAPCPAFPYGIGKFTIDQYLAFYAKAFGLRYVSLRYANVYGPRQDPSGEAGVVAIFIHRLLNRQPIQINGHGRQTRDYVFVSDVVDANIQAMQKSKVSGTFHIGTGRQTSVNRLAEALRRVSSRSGKILHRRGVAGENMKSALNAKRAHRILGWKPVVDLEDGLQQTWQWAIDGGIA